MNVAQEIFNRERKHQGDTETRIPTEGILISVEDVSKAIASLSKTSAMGTDKIPSGIIKDLGEKGRTYIANLFKKIIDGTENVPADWKGLCQGIL